MRRPGARARHPKGLRRVPFPPLQARRVRSPARPRLPPASSGKRLPWRRSHPSPPSGGPLRPRHGVCAPRSSRRAGSPSEAAPGARPPQPSGSPPDGIVFHRRERGLSFGVSRAWLLLDRSGYHVAGAFASRRPSRARRERDSNWPRSCSPAYGGARGWLIDTGTESPCVPTPTHIGESSPTAL